jgi:hypothetical protein
MSYIKYFSHIIIFIKCLIFNLVFPKAIKEIKQSKFSININIFKNNNNNKN